MIVEIEKPKPSSMQALDYNEDKVLRGVAELVGYANMEGASRKEILETFSRYEKSRYYVSAKSFHASVNPSVTDHVTEEGVLDCISGLMCRLGYGSQPWLVYRHHDIDREHWHIVSVRTDASGHKIPDRWEKRRASAYLEEVAHRYGFTVPGKGETATRCDSLAVDRPHRSIPSYDPKGEVARQLRDIWTACLGYSFESFRQMALILEDHGVGARLVETGGEPSVQLRGLGPDGAPATGWLSGGTLGLPLHHMMKEAVSSRKGTRAHASRERERMRSLVAFAFGLSRSEGHFVNILRNKGIRAHMHRTSDGELFGVTFVDHVTRTVMKASDMRDVFSVVMARGAVASGKWRTERTSTGSHQSRIRESVKELRSDTLLLRDLHVGALARLLSPLGGRPQQTAGPAGDTGRRKDDGPIAQAGGTMEDLRFVQKIS